MRFKTFFFILFTISITWGIVTTLIPDLIQNIFYTMNSNYTINITFLTLVSLITAGFALLGLLLSIYFGSKEKRIKRLKRQRDRQNVEIIQAEIQALHKESK